MSADNSSFFRSLSGEITEYLANGPHQRWYSWCYLNDAQEMFEARWEAERYLKLQAGFPKQRRA